MLNISIITHQLRQGDLAQLANKLAENVTAVSPAGWAKIKES